MSHRGEHGYTTVDLMMGVILLSLILVVLYQVFIPTFALSRNVDERLLRQQDVRLALDRVARDLHETSSVEGRVRVYACAGGPQACLGYVTARELSCSGDFRVVNGYPNWQAVVYVWRDAASNELRRWCDTTTVFPTGSWPPAVSMTPYTVLATRVVQATFTLQAVGVEVRLREQTTTASFPTYRYQTQFLNQTVFVPQNQ